MPEQDPSRFESLKQGAKEVFQSAVDFGEKKLAIGLIGAVGIAGGGVAVANQLSTETASAANIPEATATASDQTQDCVDEGLEKPKIKYAYMDRPGDKKLQSTSLRVEFPLMSQECVGFKRGGRVKFQVQNPYNHKSWTSSSFRKLVLASREDLGKDIGVAGTGSFGPWKVKNPKFLYKCTPGPDKTQVRAIYIQQVKDNGNVAGQIKRLVPLKIKYRSHPQRGGVAGKC